MRLSIGLNVFIGGVGMGGGFWVLVFGVSFWRV